MQMINELNLSPQILKEIFDLAYVDCRAVIDGVIVYDCLTVRLTFGPDRDRIKYFMSLNSPHGLPKEKWFEHAFRVSQEYDVLAEYSKDSLFINSAVYLYGGIPSSVIVKSWRRMIEIAHDIQLDYRK
ncbi:hypothetical protein [Geomonas subterranea]|uniref:hypothetical protein n=1 Tax=Geomonas subterranea TaxID=2847989 RepID=UPI001CD6A562|nr:hypothetical protein [Geomonas fuzhouensis]